MIDPQKDFVDLPQAYRATNPATGVTYQPSLPVPGAHQDMKRVANLIREAGAKINRITITLDSHNTIDIAHPPFWKTGDGGDLPAFTQVRAEDVRSGKIVPRDANPQTTERTLRYLDDLEKKARYTHMVWPEHCIIGGEGHNVHPDVHAAYVDWEHQFGQGNPAMNVGRVTKGENPFVESYSALAAEVPDPSDPKTGLKVDFLGSLPHQDELIVAGEAGSHCVRATVLDIIENMPPNGPKVALLIDCMSPVQGFEKEYHQFLKDMETAGVELITSEEARMRLKGNDEVQAGPSGSTR